MGEEWNVTNSTYTNGQIIKLQGSYLLRHSRFKVTRVTSTAIAVERYYWFDAAYDWIVRQIKAWGQK